MDVYPLSFHSHGHCAAVHLGSVNMPQSHANIGVERWGGYSFMYSMSQAKRPQVMSSDLTVGLGHRFHWPLIPLEEPYALSIDFSLRRPLHSDASSSLPWVYCEQPSPMYKVSLLPIKTCCTYRLSIELLTSESLGTTTHNLVPEAIGLNGSQSNITLIIILINTT